MRDFQKIEQKYLENPEKALDDNEKSLRELSLRMAIKLGALRKDSGDDWKEIADVTCRKGS